MGVPGWCMLVMIAPLEPDIWYGKDTPGLPPAKPMGGAMPDICPEPGIDMALDTACDAATISLEGGERAVGEGRGCCELFEVKVGKLDCCGVVR